MMFKLGLPHWFIPLSELVFAVINPGSFCSSAKEKSPSRRDRVALALTLPSSHRFGAKMRFFSAVFSQCVMGFFLLQSSHSTGGGEMRESTLR